MSENMSKQTDAPNADESDRLLVLLCEIRAACGDNGERTQDELVKHIAALAANAAMGNSPTVASACGHSAAEKLSELLRGLECGPAIAYLAPPTLFKLGQQIATQAKRAPDAGKPTKEQTLSELVAAERAATATANAAHQPQFRECRHCGFECRPNDAQSKRGYPLEQVAEDRPAAAGAGGLTLDTAPLGTKAPATGGGHWVRTERGWKWWCGSTFPRPGGDWTGELIVPAVNRYAANAGGHHD